jgi:hypothetical protein
MGSDPPGTTAAATGPLRVGILLDSLSQPAWVARALEGVLASSTAEVVLVVRRTQDGRSAPPRARGGYLPLFLRAWRRRHTLLFALYTKLDKRLFRVAANPFRRVDVGTLLEGCPLIDVTPRETRFSDCFPDPDVELIASYGLDVAVCLGFRILRGRVLEIARHGVWSWHHSDILVNRGGPPGFWEVMEGAPATGSVIQILTEELEGGDVLYRSWSRTDRHSVWRNKSGYYWKSAAFLQRALDQVHAQGEPVPVESPSLTPWRAYSHRCYRVPGNTELAHGVARLALRYGRNKARELARPAQWFIAYRFHPPEAPPDVPETAPYRFGELFPPRDRFWADPFPLLHQGRHWIFFEEKVSSAPAHIAVVEVGSQGIIGQPKVVLERPYHVSYPFVFEWEGKIYMLPETEHNRTVELYRAEDFPTRWTLDRVFFSGVRAVDATLAEIDGRWWMFVNIAEAHAPLNDELHLYHAVTPLGPWVPHVGNPVKSDVRSARPAGRPFKLHGSWYRPAQDCSGRYGAAIVVNRITRLDEKAFAEEEVGRLLPSWRPDLVATHTLNAAGGLTVIDAQRLRWRVSR